MKKTQKRKGYTIEEMDKRVAKYIQDGAKRLAAKLKLAQKKSYKITVR